MNLSSPDTFGREESRIQEAYAKRQGDNRYSLFDPGALFIVQEIERSLLALLQQRGFSSLETKRILEIGCGAGFWLREFIKWGANPKHITGIDLLADRITKARDLCPAAVRLDCASATKLPYADRTFDLVMQFTVFTSILDSTMKQQIASEMLRVVNRDGLMLWYDYHVNNPWNPDVRGVKKAEIYQLFPHCHIELRRITFIPQLTRLLAPYSWLMCYLLAKIPLFCTHYLGVIQKERIP